MLKVISFNTLADQYTKINDNDFLDIDPSLLQWTYRLELIQRKIIKWCVEGYIICLQEVDMKAWYCSLFNRLGYQVFLGNNKISCLIACPCELVVKQLINLNYLNSNEEFMIILVEGVIICNTQLKSTDRLTQIKELLSNIESDKVVIVGDLNEFVMELGTCIYHLMSNSYQNCHPFCESTKSGSIYNKVDWIWSKGLNVISSTIEMNISSILPNSSHPSNHMPIEVKFTY